ncbi:DUF1273 domain-containing protein [Bacillus sp. SCS-151]|uniref:DUF1273 domain-containing protein n=1 Tax=Nanhaiella sioensis TaxID=3115293 RepID=UPI00397D1735
MKVLVVSGYKPYEIGIFSNDHPAVNFIKKALKSRLVSLLDNGLEWVLISGQLGVELWAAETVYALQEDYPHLKLAILTPFLEQDVNWNEANKEYYELILSQADFVESISNRSYENPSQFRQKNLFLVNKSDALLAVFDEDKQGSPTYLLNVAKNRRDTDNYDIIIINFDDLHLVAEEESLMNNPWNEEF